MRFFLNDHNIRFFSICKILDLTVPKIERLTLTEIDELLFATIFSLVAKNTRCKWDLISIFDEGCGPSSFLRTQGLGPRFPYINSPEDSTFMAVWP